MSVGQELQQKRAERQLSVEQLAAITKLKVSIIRALENVDVDMLPPVVYVIGYLRLLAAELKLDSDDFVERYVAELHVERARAEAARLRAEEARLHAEERRRLEEQLRADEAARAEALARAEAARAAKEVARLQRQLAQPAHPVRASRAAVSARRQWVSAVHWPRIPRLALPPLLENTLLHRKSLIAAGLGVVVLLAIVGFDATDRPSAAPVAEAAAEAPQPQPDAVPASATPTGPLMRAEIVLTRPAFVSASTDGRSMVARQMAAGERLTLEARTRAVLRVSDPSAVSVSIDGQPARPLGNGTRAATFEVTRNAIRNFVDP